MILTQLWLLVNLGWPHFKKKKPRLTKGIWSIWPKMVIRVLRCPNGLHHVNLDVSVTSWRKDNIFEIFWVWHPNRGRTKYSVYNKQNPQTQENNGINKTHKPTNTINKFPSTNLEQATTDDWHQQIQKHSQTHDKWIATVAVVQTLTTSTQF